MRRLFYIFNLVFILILLLQPLGTCAGTGQCADCELSQADISNIVITNSTDRFGKQIGPEMSLEGTNVTFSGCPDLINIILFNSTDQFGHNLDPKITSEEVNFVYYSALDVTKHPELVTDMTEVGPNLAIVEYRIKVTNRGEVNITGILLYDSISGSYYLGKLTPGQNVTITPYPKYAITADDIKSCWINNIAIATGKDRCCKFVGPFYTRAFFPMGVENYENYLKIYSDELLDYGFDLKDHMDADELKDYERLIRYQANRLLTFEDLLHENVSTCQLPDPVNIAILNATDENGCSLGPGIVQEKVNLTDEIP